MGYVCIILFLVKNNLHVKKKYITDVDFNEQIQNKINRREWTLINNFSKTWVYNEDGTKIPDTIIKFEDLSTLFERISEILKKYGFKIISNTFPFMNKSKFREFKNYRQYYNEESKNFVNNQHKKIYRRI